MHSLELWQGISSRSAFLWGRAGEEQLLCTVIPGKGTETSQSQLGTARCISQAENSPDSTVSSVCLLSFCCVIVIAVLVLP